MAVRVNISNREAEEIAKAIPLMTASQAKLTLMWLVMKPAEKNALLEEMHQLVAVQKDCRPRVPTRAELTAELAR